MAKQDSLQGSLNLLVLRILSRQAPLHGYAIMTAIEQISGEVLRVEEGSLYPALHRMEEAGWIQASWLDKGKGRRSRVYELTTQGRKQLAAEELRWSARYRRSIADFLRDGRRTAFDAEFIAGGLVAASESVLREWVQRNGQADPAKTFRDQVSAHQDKVGGGTAVLIESGLSLDEVRKRLGLH